MRVVMSVDIEGASGVVSSREMGYPRNPAGDPRTLPEYQDSRRWVTGDVNAAIEGAAKAGVSDFVVHDSHGTDYMNVILDELHPSAEIVKGMPNFFLDIDDLSDGRYDACFLIGMHARAGEAGVISHVIDWPRITEARVNGMPVSEAHLTIGLAEHFHIPCVLVTGDNIICREVEEWMDGNIETAVVKRSFSRYSARCIALKKTQALIHEAAYRAMSNIQGFKKEHFHRPLLLEVDFTDRQVARYVSWMPQLIYDGNRTVSYKAQDFLSLHKTLFAMQALAHLD